MRDRKKLGTFFFFAGFLGFMFVMLLDPGQYILRQLENRFPKPEISEIVDPKGFIILGGAIDTLQSDERGEILFIDSAERVTVIPSLMRQFPEAQFIFSGGSFGEKTKGEGAFVQEYLESIGLDESRLLLETSSTNTAENAALTMEKYDLEEGKGWYLITSAWHMPRAMGLFQKQGATELKAYPVDYRTGNKHHFRHRANAGLRTYQLSIARREILGLLGYWALGYTDQPFPSPYEEESKK